MLNLINRPDYVRMSLLGASFVVLTTAAPAFAQGDSAPAQQQVPGGTQPDNGDIVVTARRVAERLQDIPLAITALGGENLRDQSIRELRNLTSVAPGLIIKEHSNNPQGLVISMRGQTAIGIILTTDSAVGVYSDGISVPRANGMRGALVDLARIEVLRGPQGTLYGRNTTGGAVSLITNNPTDRLEGSAQITLGNYATARGLGILNVPLTESIATRLVVERGVHAGYGRNGVGNPLNDEDSTLLRGKVKGEWGGFSAVLSGEYTRYSLVGTIDRPTGIVAGSTLAIRQIAAELGLPMTAPSSASFLVGDPATPAALAAANAAFSAYLLGQGPDYQNGASATYNRFNSHNLSLDLGLELNDNLKLRSLTGYRYYDRANSQDLDATPFNILFADFKTDDRFFSQELQLQGKYGRLSFVVGGYYSDEDGFESSRTLTAPRVLANSQTNAEGYVTSRSLAGFGQFNFEVVDGLTITGGLRYTREEKRLTSVSTDGLGNCRVPVALQDTPGICRGTFSKTFSDPSWLGSVDYKIMPGVMIYAKVARGFRAGGQNLRGFSADSFAPFGPETITEYEGGIKSEFLDRRLRLNLSVFHDDYNDVQRSITLIGQSGGVSTLITNAAQAKIDGIEIEASARPIDGLSLGATVSYTNARYAKFVDATGDRTGEDWPTPDWTYAFTGRYELPTSFGNVAVQADYQGQSAQNLLPYGQRLKGTTTQPAYGIVNGRLSAEIGSQNVSMALYVRNLTDKVYAVGGDTLEGVGYNIKYIGEPRNFGIEISKKF